MTAADLQRLDFLQALGRRDLPLSGWEQEFLAGFRQSSRPTLWFTSRRRAATDRLLEKYATTPPDHFSPAKN